MANRQIHSSPIEIKMSSVMAVSVILRESSLEALASALKKLTSGASDFFDGEFAVIDIGQMGSKTDIDWGSISTLLKSHNLNPVSVRHAPPEMEHEIRIHGLYLDTSAQPPQHKIEEDLDPLPPTTSASTKNTDTPHQSQTLIIDTPVRGGQRIYARGADLIITAAVNNGAEVIADGSIHIYAPLRGRALAGASGNPNARIFTMNMEAELVSIAGIYSTFDTGLPSHVAQQATQICLVGDKLSMSALNNGTRT